MCSHCRVRHWKPLVHSLQLSATKPAHTNNTTRVLHSHMIASWPKKKKEKTRRYQHCWPGKTLLVASSFTQNKWFKGELLNATSLLFWCCQRSNDGQLFSPGPLWQFCTSPGRVRLKVTVLFVHLSAPRGFCNENTPVKFGCESRSWQLRRVCQPSPRCFVGRRGACTEAKMQPCQGFSVGYNVFAQAALSEEITGSLSRFLSYRSELVFSSH